MGNWHTKSFFSTAYVLLFAYLLLIPALMIFRQTASYVYAYPVEESKETIEVISEASTVSYSDISLLFGGDIMLARTIEPQILNNGFNPFKNVIELFDSNDLVVANLEYVAASKGIQRLGKLYTFRAAPETLDVLTHSGIDVVSVANNHAGDYGLEAFSEMLQNLRQRNIGYFGGGSNVEQAYAPLYVSIKGVSIALIGFNMIEIPWFAATEESGGIAWIDESRLSETIKQADENSDYVIVMPHWGLEYTAQLNSDQQRLGRLAIDSGANLVIGGHSHHIQPSEKYSEGEIFYSMGNLVFDGPGPAGWGFGEFIQIEIIDGGLSTSKIPYQVLQSGEVVLL